MDWEAVGAIGNLVGAVAVVVSLAYLALQVRGQNNEARAAAMHEIYAGFRESIATFAKRDQAEVMARANEDFDSLSDGDLIILISAAQVLLRLWEEAFHQHNQGRLDAHIWDVIADQYSSLLGNPAIGNVWELRKEFYDPRFRAYVEQKGIAQFRLREAPANQQKAGT